MRPLEIIPFGEWLPDLPDIGNPGVTEAKNVIPHGIGYRPHPGLGSAVSSALDARCQGAIAMIGDDGFSYTFAGDATKLYRLVDATFTDASKSGSYTVAADERWEFTKFADKVIAVAPQETMQAMATNGTQFADLPTSTLKPQASHVGVVRRFVVIGHTTESNVVYPRRVRWSAIGDETDWDSSDSTLAGRQDLDGNYGYVQAVVGGGEYGVILQEGAITRMEFVGSPEKFAFDLVEQNRGALVSGSVVAWGGIVAFLSADGFFLFDGAQARPIGDMKFNQWFFDLADPSFYSRMFATVDPLNSCFRWLFTSTSSSDGTPDYELLYHWPTGRAAYALVSAQAVFPALTLGTSLDGLDSVSASLDALPFSLDSRAWSGGTARLGGFNSSNQLAFFDGSNLAATVETDLRQLLPGLRALCNAARPLVDGGTVDGTDIAVQVSTREKFNDADSFGAEALQTADGLCPLFASGRYHKFRVNVDAATTWTHAVGVEPHGQPDGMF